MPRSDPGFCLCRSELSGASAPGPAWPPGQGGNYWGWMPRSHALTVGDWVHVDTGGVWTVTGIAAMPGDCDPFAEPLGTVVGRLVLGPIKRR